MDANMDKFVEELKEARESHLWNQARKVRRRLVYVQAG